MELYVAHHEDENDTVRWLVQAAFVPGWGVSPDRYISVSALVVDDICVAVLLAGLAFFASRLLARGASGWIRCLAVGVLASELSVLLWWVLAEAFVHDLVLSPGVLLRNLMRGALIFGLAIGVLFALLAVGLPGTRAAGSIDAAKTSFRRRKGDVGMTTAQVRMPVGSVRGDVTRYLCAAAYADERFADRVVEGVLADEASAVAPSPDVDLVAVARHCLAAQEIRYHRDLRLAGAFGVVALLAPLGLVFATLLLSITERAARSKPSLATRGQHQPDSRALVGAGVTAGVVVICAFFFGAAVSSLPQPGFVAWLLGAYLSGVPAVLASIGAVLYAYVTVVRHDLNTDRLLRTTMTREAFARQPLPAVPQREWIAKRLAVVKEARDGNVTVYSGYSPFIGYAEASSNWSLAVPLLPADDPVDTSSRPAEPEAFTVTELIDHVREQLRAVAARSGADGTADADEEALGSLTIEDRVFVSGATIGDDDRFMTATRLTPAVRLSPEAVEEIMLHPTGTVRHCLAVHVPLWGGDVVPSVFLHFSTAGRTLHLHCDNHVLGPVEAAYHLVDRLRDPLTAERQRGLMVAALSRTSTAFIGALFHAVRHARFEARHSRRMVDELKAMEQDPVFDYGARLSVREMALSPRYHNYFQVVDAGRITSAVERHTLAAIREFLDTHGYDTTDFRSQQQTILNQGLIQQGGMSIIGNQAIGAGSSATQHVTQKPGTAAAGAGSGSDK
ncbi:hypothetical protein [Streptomyces sp. SD15]